MTALLSIGLRDLWVVLLCADSDGYNRSEGCCRPVLATSLPVGWTVQSILVRRTHVSDSWADQLAVRLGRPPSPVTLAQTMLQVTSHSSHHRGQVNVRLRELGCEPPLIDFITWLWLGKPSADWDSLSAGASNLQMEATRAGS